MNCSSRVTCINISDDSSLCGVGFSDSIIKMWTLLPHKLKKLKSAEALKDINRYSFEDTDILIIRLKTHLRVSEHQTEKELGSFLPKISLF